MKWPLLMKQTLLRAGAIFLVKVFGLIGRISLTRLVGAEGVGLYQVAYSSYGLMLILITGGLPTALALFTAKNSTQGWFWFKIISLFTLLFGGIASYFVYRYSEMFAQFLGQPKLGYTIRCLSPALFAVPMLSLLRGYLQGLERFEMIAVSEVVEQLVRVTSIVLLVPLFLSGGISKAVGGSVLGTFAGAILAFLILTIQLSNSRDESSLRKSNFSDFGSNLSALFKASLAIALTRMLIPASDFVDALLIPSRLQTAGYSALEATQIFGVFMGMAVILVYTPTLLTAALSHTLTMKIAADWQNGRTDKFFRLMHAAFKIGWLWGLTSGLLLYVFAADLSLYIFGSYEAEQPIRYLAPLPLIVGIREISTSILWAQNRKKIPFAGLACGILINIALLYFLLALPEFGYIGASIGILSMEIVATVWNLYYLKVFRSNMNRIKFLFLDLSMLIIFMLTVSMAVSSLESIILFRPLIILIKMLLFCGFAGTYIKIRCTDFL